MHRQDHHLPSPSLGSQKTLSSFHFGHAGVAPKIYIQASLHAEELPGMLVAHHLRALLEHAEAAGSVHGEIILVPVANPIGLAQRLDHKAMGRFELDSSENFNRHYPDLAATVLAQVSPQLGDDAQTNVTTVRTAVAQYLLSWVPDTELQGLRRQLLSLAHDADFVLDLHCDGEAVMHFYTEEACWPQLEPLTRYLQCQAVLLAKKSGSGPFDECLSGLWWQLAELLQASGQTAPLAQGCCSTTIELRGEADVSHAQAHADAQAIYSFLQHAGAIAPADDQEISVLPTALCTATPLAGSETLHSPVPGVVAFWVQPGDKVAAGDLVAEVINPLTNHCQPIKAGVSGVLYARIRERYVHRGGELAKIAGATPFRTGELLGA